MLRIQVERIEGSRADITTNLREFPERTCGGQPWLRHMRHPFHISGILEERLRLITKRFRSVVGVLRLSFREYSSNQYLQKYTIETLIWKVISKCFQKTLIICVCYFNIKRLWGSIIHQEIVSVQYIPPPTPLLYTTRGPLVLRTLT